MNQGWASARVAVERPTALGERRVERLTALMGPDWLSGEWDGQRELVLPRPGGRLTRVLPCAVAGCPGDVHGASVLCHLHRRQFEASPGADVQGWMASGEPNAIERRWCSDQRCAVTRPRAVVKYRV